MARFCEQCGKPLSPTARFCRECGAAVPTEAANAEAAPKNAGASSAGGTPPLVIPTRGPVVSVEVSDEPPAIKKTVKTAQSKPISDPGRRSSAAHAPAAPTAPPAEAVKKTKEKMPGGRKLLALVLAVLDIALLVMIVKAAKAEKATGYEQPGGSSVSYGYPSGGTNIGSGSNGSGSGTSSASGNGGSSAGSAKTEALSGLEYSTLERPAEADFAWYHEVCSTGKLPEDAKLIQEGDEVIGSWKGYIYYDYRSTEGIDADEYVNATITVSGGTGSLLIDWYQIQWNGEEPADETQEEDTLFTGTWEDGRLEVDGSVPVRIVYFYRTDGAQQYAFGTIDVGEGGKGYIALVRP